MTLLIFSTLNIKSHIFKTTTKILLFVLHSRLLELNPLFWSLPTTSCNEKTRVERTNASRTITQIRFGRWKWTAGGCLERVTAKVRVVYNSISLTARWCKGISSGLRNVWNRPPLARKERAGECSPGGLFTATSHPRQLTIPEIYGARVRYTIISRGFSVSRSYKVRRCSSY